MRLSCLVVAGLLHASVLHAEDANSVALDPKEAKEGFVSLFGAKVLNDWQGAVGGYEVVMICRPGGNLYTNEYGDFIFRFDFKLPPGGNNGVGIRTPMGANAAYHGMEIQILDDTAERYRGRLKPYQYHGSIYGVVAAETGHLKPVGQWNSEEVMCKGGHVKVTLNGVVIVDADISKIDKTIDGQDHPGLHNAKGYIGFLGHGSPVEFRNVRIKELK